MSFISSPNAAATSVPTPPVLEGLDAHVDYWLNGRRIGKSAQYYLDRVQTGSTDKIVSSLSSLQQSVESVLGLSPYAVQSAAALALTEGNIVEMATGEGKTLTLAMAAASLALTGNQVHILTANDYLASRDASDMSALYSSQQLSCAAITGDMNQQQRQQAYQSAIVYSTAKELLADYLRDNLAVEGHANNTGQGTSKNPPTQLIQSLTHVLVDEADHLLIDEAQTPLIISEEAEQDPRFVMLYRKVFAEIGNLQEGTDYHLNRQLQSINLKASAVSSIAKKLAHQDAIFQNNSWLYSLVKRALAIEKFLIQGKHYLVEDNSINILVAKTILGSLGITPTIAMNGLEAVECVKTYPSYDLVLMDIQMPEMDGIEATREIREKLNIIDLPIVAMTANVMAEEIEQYEKIGMSGHLGKPYDSEQLINIIEHIIGNTKKVS